MSNSSNEVVAAITHFAGGSKKEYILILADCMECFCIVFALSNQHLKLKNSQPAWII